MNNRLTRSHSHSQSSTLFRRTAGAAAGATQPRTSRTGTAAFRSVFGEVASPELPLWDHGLLDRLQTTLTRYRE